MKKIFVMLALAMGVVSANAQSVDSTAVTNTVAGDVTLTTDIYPQQEDGDIYHGLTKKLTFDVEALLSTQLKIKPGDVFDVYEIDDNAPGTTSPAV